MLSVKLSQFEGPVDLLQTLIQKDEIDIYTIELYQIVRQILQACSPNVLDQGAESMGCAGNLLWLKSRALLPKEDQVETLLEEESDFRLPFFERLVEYCRFKEAGKQLCEREEKAAEAYLRNVFNPQVKKPLGIEHLSLNDLASLFQDVLLHSKETKGLIHEEEWKVADKISSLRNLLKEGERIPFEILFASHKSKIELIVLFLAVLELIKLGEMGVFKEQSSVYFMHP